MPLRSEAVARRVSTPTSWPRPVFSFQRSDTASPTAPRLAAEVSPIRKGVGRMGSSRPIISASEERAVSHPTVERIVDNAWCTTCIPPNSALEILYQSSLEARLAPSTIDASLAHAIFDSTLRPHAEVPKPQSLLAMTFSRPTTEA